MRSAKKKNAQTLSTETDQTTGGNADVLVFLAPEIVTLVLHPEQSFSPENNYRYFIRIIMKKFKNLLTLPFFFVQMSQLRWINAINTTTTSHKNKP